ncbi:MAG: hypothetical protein ACI9GW_002725 [Halieaceae bacterium]|jgi:hypothetical protein
MLRLNPRGYQTGTFCPKLLGQFNRIDFLVLPPPDLVTGVLECAVMDATKGYHPLIARFFGQRIGLHAFQMVRVCGLALTSAWRRASLSFGV